MNKNRKLNINSTFLYIAFFALKWLDIIKKKQYNYIGKDFEISAKNYKISLATKGNPFP
ncbi:MAG: hypothetical protein IJX24_07925 [Oscillospiraceae bacterium]|nr:hypothetical protein [Oscillospiraceae bacterium]